MRSALLCIAGILLVAQAAWAGVTVTSASWELISFGQIGTAVNQSDLGGFLYLLGDTSPAPSVNRQDSASLSQASVTASSLFTSEFKYDAQNSLQELIVRGLAVATANSTSAAISTYAQATPGIVVLFSVTGAPVTYSLSGVTSSVGGGGEGQLILVQLGGSDIARLTNPGAFSQTGQLQPGDYQLIYSTSAAAGVGGMGTDLSAGNLSADLTFTPEPASLLMLGLAAAGLLLRRHHI